MQEEGKQEDEDLFMRNLCALAHAQAGDIVSK